MTKKSAWLLFSLGLVFALQGAAQTAPTEAQPQIQAPSALTKPSTPACALPCLSAEQETALVEVRKILQEARQVAESIEITQGNIQAQTKGVREMILKDLQAQKTTLLESIERAQFRAGDFSAAATTKQPWSLALAQVKYGRTRDAVQSASRDRLGGDTLLVLVDALIRAGAMEGAITVAETDVAKEGVPSTRFREQATVLSLIARRQHEGGAPSAKATLQRAVKAAQVVTYPPDKYLALIHVARAQAAMGDRVASSETFQQAIETIVVYGTKQKRSPGETAEGLRRIAKAQAESGDRTASDKTFQQTIQILDDAPLPRIFNLNCIAWSQMLSENRVAAEKTFRLVLERSDALQPEKRVDVLIELGKWQRKVGEREAVAETVQHAFESAKAIQDAKKKSGALSSIAAFATRSGYFKMSMEIIGGIEDNRLKISNVGLLAEELAKTKDPFGTPDVFRKLVGTATAITEQPLPQGNVHEKVDASSIMRSVAMTQAAAGDLQAALRTIESMRSDTGTMETLTYADILKMLIAKRDLSGAQKIAASFKEEWVKQGRRIAKQLRDLGKEYATTGDLSAALAWARQLTVSYDKSYALLGVAEGLIDRKGIEDLGGVSSEVHWRDDCPGTLELMN